MHDIAASSLLSEHEILHIPNGLDLNLYYPRDGSLLRPLLGIPKDNFVIIMAAENLKDKRKGVASIFEAISILHKSIKEQITLLLIGNAHGFEQLDLGVHEVRMGFVYEENLKASLFSLADIFVFPSIADNLPIVIQESLACGTPVISFDVGGIPEMVINDVTGWLLEEASYELLSEAITKVVSNREGVSALSDSCRKFACEYYAIEDQVSNYANLYSRLVE
jgi:glycosyltransferase involved in cell wall biosynthesis